MAKTIVCDIESLWQLPGAVPLMDQRDRVTLQHLIQSVQKKGVMIAEVGCWMGGATAILASAVANLDGKVFAIDHWRGSPKTWESMVTQAIDVYAYFKGNMIELGVWDTIYPLVMNSATACEIFANNILDMAFIDADHRYEFVKQDILGWLPKVKDSGILCGHDATPPSENGTGQAVIRALDECLIGYSIIQDSTMWYINEKPLQEAKRRLKDKGAQEALSDGVYEK